MMQPLNDWKPGNFAQFEFNFYNTKPLILPTETGVLYGVNLGGFKINFFGFYRRIALYLTILFQYSQYPTKTTVGEKTVWRCLQSVANPSPSWFPWENTGNYCACTPTFRVPDNPIPPHIRFSDPGIFRWESMSVIHWFVVFHWRGLPNLGLTWQYPA